MRKIVLVMVLLAACSDGAATSPTTVTAAPTTTAAPATTTAAPTTTAALTPASPVEPLPVLPVGPGGIEYRGEGPEVETFGPTSVTIGPDGSVHIVDPVANRILSYFPDHTSEIDLGSIDILSAPFVAAASDHLVVVEIFFAPLREKVHRVGYDGTVLASFQLPIAGRLDRGLSGVMVDEQDRIHLVIEGGLDYLQLDDATLAFTALGAFADHGVTVAQEVLGVSIDGVSVTADLTGEVGGMRLLDIAADGTVVTVREDVVSLDPITVVQSVEWYSPDGIFLGSAPVDLTAQAIDYPPGLAVAPDGTVVVLYARSDVVEVVALERMPERFGV